MKKKFYKLPLYKSNTNVMRLKRAGDIVCYLGAFGVKEVVSNKNIYIINILDRNKRGTDEFVNKNNKFLSYMHKKAIKEEGVKLYIKEEDLNKAKPISKAVFREYIDDYEKYEFNEIQKHICEFQQKKQIMKQKIK